MVGGVVGGRAARNVTPGAKTRTPTVNAVAGAGVANRPAWAQLAGTAMELDASAILRAKASRRPGDRRLAWQLA